MVVVLSIAVAACADADDGLGARRTKQDAAHAGELGGRLSDGR